MEIWADAMITAVVLNGVTFFEGFELTEGQGSFLKLPHCMNLRGVTLNRFFITAQLRFCGAWALCYFCQPSEITEVLNLK